MPRKHITNEQLYAELQAVKKLLTETQVVHYVSYPVYPPSQPQSFFTVTGTGGTPPPSPIPMNAGSPHANT